MPKNKKHSGTAKRIKVTGTGKLIHKRAGMRHKLEKKPSTLARRLNKDAEASPADRPRLRKLLGL
jgi:large subunit ribosomal protein L35